MKAIITGMKGTFAPYIYEHLKENQWELIAWERQNLPNDNKEALENFIKEHMPDVFIHVANGSVEWLTFIIEGIRPYSIPLVFISSDTVFSGKEGPFTINDIPHAINDYGHYKITCERLIASKYKEYSYVIRLGWQIAHHTHKNSLLSYLINEEHVHASDDWILSTSFMSDSAAAIEKILRQYPTGIYHLDSNEDNLTFYELVTKLKDIYKLPITIEKTHTTKHNSRLLSDEPLMPPLKLTVK